MISQDDYDLVNGLRANDPICQRQLVDNYSGRLLTFVLREGLRHQDAVEVVNDTLHKIIKKIDTFDPSKESKFSSWIIKIAINTARDKLKKKKRLLDSQSLDDLNDKGFQSTDTLCEAVTQVESNMGQLSQEIMSEALGSLNETDQDILRLCAAGYHHHEIAALTNKTPGAVKVAHFRAKKRLKEKYLDILESTGNKTTIMAIKDFLSIEEANEKEKN